MGRNENNPPSRGFFHRMWHGRTGRTPWLRRIMLVIFFVALPLPVLLLFVFRFVPVPGTPSMLIDLVSLQPVHYSWRGADQIAPTLGRAVIGAEDDNFCTHHGFDFKAIDKAWKDHELRHKPLRGASTISQQAARELFLTSWRSVIRKGAEAWLTVLMEVLWPKQRILTVYLNVVDWGHGNFGAEAAAQSYFGTSAADLTPARAARLAAILPNPDKWKAANPGHYVRKRAGTLAARQRQVKADALDWCVR